MKAHILKRTHYEGRNVLIFINLLIPKQKWRHQDAVQNGMRILILSTSPAQHCLN